jgi:hypothetical protein
MHALPGQQVQSKVSGPEGAKALWLRVSINPAENVSGAQCTELLRVCPDLKRDDFSLNRLGIPKSGRV